MAGLWKCTAAAITSPRSSRSTPRPVPSVREARPEPDSRNAHSSRSSWLPPTMGGGSRCRSCRRAGPAPQAPRGPVRGAETATCRSPCCRESRQRSPIRRACARQAGDNRRPRWWSEIPSCTFMHISASVQSIDSCGIACRTRTYGGSDVRPIQRLAADPERRSRAVCDRAAVACRQPVGGRAGRPDRHAARRAAGADPLSRARGRWSCCSMR